MVKSTNPIPLEGLEPDEFFTFFVAFIFDGKKPEDYQHALTDVARNIAKKLKGSPLAAKTVGRLLRKDLSREHWMGVLENNEWQNQKNDDDIMPSLRISYDYLPFHLKKCFPYFALFPEDYMFNKLEITYFWSAIGVIDKDEKYMEELVDNGFLVKGKNDRWGEHYVMHDLLHELSRSVSSQECLNINSSVSFRADAIPKSIRHLSITMEDRYEETFRTEMVKMRSKIDIVNLRALMIFRAYRENIDEILKETFKEIEGLRVLLVEVKSVESLPHNFSKLIHLRYLKISTPKYDPEVTLPSTLSRFYHLILLDLSSWHGSTKLPKDVSHLINLRHFVAGQELHSNVSAVGNMKYLKKLKEFRVKKENDGFELSELGELTELGGELRICDLENVTNKEEAEKAKLVLKKDLKALTLVWGTTNQQITESDVLVGLEPHRNLQSLGIVNHGGSTGPSWFSGGNISTMMLTSLHLEGVSWVDPPFGQLLQLTSLKLKGISGLGQIRPGYGGAMDRSFMKLKKIDLENLPRFSEWVGSPDAQTFSGLAKIRCISCPSLCSLPFLQESSAVTYNHLRELVIRDCPKLFLPPMPHTSTLTTIDVSPRGVGNMKYKKFTKKLCLYGYIGEVVWQNMASKVVSISFSRGSTIPWEELPDLTSLREFEIVEEPSFVSMALLSNLPTSLTSISLVNCENLTVDGFNPLIAAVNLKKLRIHNTGYGPRSAAADLLSELVVAKPLLPAAGCFQLETLVVDCISAVLAAPVCSLFATTLHKLDFCCDQRVESFTEEEEKALQLLTSLQALTFWWCPGLPSLPQGLHSLSSLRTLYLEECPEIRSLPKGGLPTSLRKLDLRFCHEIRSLPEEGLPTSLRELFVVYCSPELQEQAKKLQGRKPDLRMGC